MSSDLKEFVSIMPLKDVLLAPGPASSERGRFVCEKSWYHSFRALRRSTGMSRTAWRVLRQKKRIVIFAGSQASMEAPLSRIQRQEGVW